MSNTLERFWYIEEFNMPQAVLLSVLMEAGGYGWPNSWRVIRIGMANLPLWYTVCVSASAAEVMTLRRVAHPVWIGQLGTGLGSTLVDGGVLLR